MAAILDVDSGPEVLTPLLNKANLVFVSQNSQSLIDLRALFRGKYTVFAATSRPQALEIVRNETIHAIVSEQSMPQMSGYELLRDVRKVSPNTLRMLLASAMETQALGPAIRKDDIFHIIAKPWQAEEIIKVIDNAVKIALLSSDASSAVQAKGREFSIVVLDDVGDIFRQARRLCQNEYSFLRARSLEQAIGRVANDDVALLITDVSLGQADNKAFFQRLNQQYPQLMILALVSSVDSELAMELVNQGQIYRYLRKPVSDSLLRRGIKHGIRFYAMNRFEPATGTDTSSNGEKNADGSLINRLISRLGLLRTQVRLSLS